MTNDEIMINNNEVSLFAQASKFCRRRRLIISTRRFRRATAQFESLLIKFEWQTYLIPLRDDDMGDVRNVGAHPFGSLRQLNQYVLIALSSTFQVSYVLLSLSLSSSLLNKHNRRLSSSAQVLSNRLKISSFFLLLLQTFPLPFFSSSSVRHSSRFHFFSRSVTQNPLLGMKKTLQVLSRPKNRRLQSRPDPKRHFQVLSLYKRLRKKKKNDSSDATFSILDLFRPRASAIKS